MRIHKYILFNHRSIRVYHLSFASLLPPYLQNRASRTCSLVRTALRMSISVPLFISWLMGQNPNTARDLTQVCLSVARQLGTVHTQQLCHALGLAADRFSSGDTWILEFNMGVLVIFLNLPPYSFSFVVSWMDGWMDLKRFPCVLCLVVVGSWSFFGSGREG